jgi:hypothetical protein
VKILKVLVSGSINRGNAMKTMWRTAGMSLVTVLALATAGLVLSSGCDSRGGQTGEATSAAKSPASLPAGTVLAQAPEGAVNVAEAKTTAQKGDKITVRGRIGGKVKPFVADRAVFQLVDASIPTCIDKHGDGCPTPWDYCCEPKDQVTAKSATVQLTGPDGKPLELNLNGVSGIEPMAMVVVRGEVADKPNENVMIINAEGVYVEQ